MHALSIVIASRCTFWCMPRCSPIQYLIYISCTKNEELLSTYTPLVNCQLLIFQALGGEAGVFILGCGHGRGRSRRGKFAQKHTWIWGVGGGVHIHYAQTNLPQLQQRFLCESLCSRDQMQGKRAVTANYLSHTGLYTHFSLLQVVLFFSFLNRSL